MISGDSLGKALRGLFSYPYKHPRRNKKRKPVVLRGCQTGNFMLHYPRRGEVAMTYFGYLLETGSDDCQDSYAKYLTNVCKYDEKYAKSMADSAIPKLLEKCYQCGNLVSREYGRCDVYYRSTAGRACGIGKSSRYGQRRTSLVRRCFGACNRLHRWIDGG